VLGHNRHEAPDANRSHVASQIKNKNKKLSNKKKAYVLGSSNGDRVAWISAGRPREHMSSRSIPDTKSVLVLRQDRFWLQWTRNMHLQPTISLYGETSSIASFSHSVVFFFFFFLFFFFAPSIRSFFLTTAKFLCVCCNLTIGSNIFFSRFFSLLIREVWFVWFVFV
jgi:hypothetical protein